MSSFVFINQHEIEFQNDAQQAQTITIFNPYDFTIKFTFKSTRPDAFILSATHGDILSRHSLDVLITLLDKTIVEEKFLIKIYSKEKKLGEKTVRVTYRPDDQHQQHHQQQQSKRLKDDHFHDLNEPKSMSFRPMEGERAPHNGQHQYLICTALAICLLILLLPHDESHYSYLQVGVNVKICAAYVLGIVTVLLIRN
ncbi:hypothetical protein BLA29_008920 [Euroglyphus maynei]|uniref:MSP domain-containing protein n=1 Tax=Euroglyphus maynei TaxID=6958 RepID=A0A1Y3B5J4_EURMA|nr:hypothetical protein BLA29_008920 [Euroglyphus maynei]